MEFMTDLKIIFSKHALYQIAERSLSKNEIISTISKPDKIIPQNNHKFKAVRRLKKNNKQYLLVVIYRKINSISKVITAFLTSKVNKYLK